VTIEHAGAEILDQHVAALDQVGEDLAAALGLRIEGDAPLVGVEHREVQAVDARDVLQLSARDVSATGQFDFDHVRAKPREDLGADRSRLHVGHVENAHAVERLPGRGRSCVCGRFQRLTHDATHLYIVWFMVPGANDV
jgi:hypothetical protein